MCVQCKTATNRGWVELCGEVLSAARFLLSFVGDACACWICWDPIPSNGSLPDWTLWASLSSCLVWVWLSLLIIFVVLLLRPTKFYWFRAKQIGLQVQPPARLNPRVRQGGLGGLKFFSEFNILIQSTIFNGFSRLTLRNKPVLLSLLLK